MKSRASLCAFLACAIALSGCFVTDLVGPCRGDRICVEGTARFFSFEGGFWAVRGDDSVTYDPVGGLPAEFRQAGLRVHLIARERKDLIGFHQAGPIVDIIAIRKLN